MPAWLFTLFPAAAAILGAALAAWRRPGPVFASAFQHFAAGVVFAAAAAEILPDLRLAGATAPVVVGGGAGVLTMLLLKEIEERGNGPAGLVAGVALDLLIGGLVLGIAFVASTGIGVLLTIALTIEVLFLGVTLAAKRGERMSLAAAVGQTAGVVLLLPLGAILAEPVPTFPPFALAAFFAFGLLALLYRVTESWLAEAHAIPDRPWVTAMFFVGFLLILLIADAIG